MSTDPSAAAGAEPGAVAAPDGTEQRIRLENAALVRRGTIPVIVLGVLLVVAFTIGEGASGFWGAVVGLVLVALFYGSDIVLMRKTADLVPMAVFAVMSMAFVFKLTLLAVFLVVLKDTTAFSVAAFATTVIVLTSVGLLVAVWLSAKTTTVIEPSAAEPAEGETSA